jgi:hypothetical protein
VTSRGYVGDHWICGDMHARAGYFLNINIFQGEKTNQPVFLLESYMGLPFLVNLNER